MLTFVCIGPRPHPATHASILTWVDGWGRGRVQHLFASMV